MVGKVKIKHIVFIVLVVLLAALFFSFSRHLKTYTVDIGQIENIDGIEFPVPDKTVITEKLAHADIYLERSPFARALNVTTTFKPLDSASLFVGIRENDFWLSYPTYQLCCTKDQHANGDSTMSKTITIPITDKILDANGSLDLMFFATNVSSTNKEDEGLGDKTMWVLEDIKVTSVPFKPTYTEVKDYIKSRLTRERPL